MRRILDKVKLFAELVKFEHSVFALPYAYVGALYGAAERGNLPSLVSLFWITVVMVAARAFAFVLNRAVDKEIDARNPRTAGRAVPAGRITAWELWGFAAAVLVLYLVGVWQLAPVVRWLAPVPLAAFVVYPYTKRFTKLCHYWLGMCLGLAPVGAWLAVGASAGDPAPWLMGLAVALWTAGFDIIYATQDVECDRRDGVHSMPADIGVGPALVQTRFLHALTVLLLVAAGASAGAGAGWFVGIGAAAALLWYENSIVSADDLSRVDAAFFTTNGVIAIVVLMGALVDRVTGV
ncbi:MAG: putative 4-hydroxybenzoate polyprenyltransferase [Coriobacteriia bacterium]|nr:putative 4-hydroxybenzoate polyprenyltransferase [Coriobacteriia bacterium]